MKEVMNMKSTMKVMVVAMLNMAGAVGYAYQNEGIGLSSNSVAHITHIVITQDFQVVIGTGVVGRINWNDKNLSVKYEEYGAPFSPHEILSLNFNSQTLTCRCYSSHFDDRPDPPANNPKPYLSLDLKCNTAEWDYLVKTLRASGLEKWNTSYVCSGVCDGTYWKLEVFSGSQVVKKVRGSNAWPEKGFDRIFEIKKHAMAHPLACHYDENKKVLE